MGELLISQRMNFGRWKLIGEVLFFFGSVSVENDERKLSQNFLMEFPLIKLVKLIIPKHKKNFASRIFLLCGLQCMKSETGFLGEYFLIVCHELGMFLGHCINHREPMDCREKRLLIA